MNEKHAAVARRMDKNFMVFPKSKREKGPQSSRSI
jgi:hypothetical protein